MRKSFIDKLVILNSRLVAIEEKLDKKVADREKIVIQLYKEIDDLKKRLNFLEKIIIDKWRVGGIYG